MIEFFKNNSEIIAVLLPSVLTFFLGRISSSSTYNNNLLQDQLSKIYKPLALRIHYSSKSFSNIEEGSHFLKYVHEIIAQNFEYIPSKLLSFEPQIEKSIKNKNLDELNAAYKAFSEYILIQFDVIRSKLNLPTNSLRNRWILMSTKDKVGFLCEKFLAPLVIGSIFASILTIGIVLTIAFFNKDIVITEENIDKTFFLCIPYGCLIFIAITSKSKRNSN